MRSLSLHSYQFLIYSIRFYETLIYGRRGDSENGEGICLHKVRLLLRTITTTTTTTNFVKYSFSLHNLCIDGNSDRGKEKRQASIWFDHIRVSHSLGTSHTPVDRVFQNSRFFPLSLSLIFLFQAERLSSRASCFQLSLPSEIRTTLEK